MPWKTDVAPPKVQQTSLFWLDTSGHLHTNLEPLCPVPLPTPLHLAIITEEGVQAYFRFTPEGQIELHIVPSQTRFSPICIYPGEHDGPAP